MQAFQSVFSRHQPATPHHWVYVHPDQLHPERLLEALPVNARPETGFLFIESSRRWKLLPFHKKRIVFEIAAMRHLAVELIEQGRAVHYAITDESFSTCLNTLLDSNIAPLHGIHSTPPAPAAPDTTFSLHCMHPASLDEREALLAVQARNPLHITLHPNTFFLADVQEYRPKISPGYRMEFFYRDMRRKYNLLMDSGNQPVGGEWNYDKENRKPLPRTIDLPDFPGFQPDAITTEAVAYTEATFPEHFGTAGNFTMAVTRAQAESLADHFFTHSLPRFGPYEDAMLKGEAYLFHSSLSAYLNTGLLNPLELCRRAEQAFHSGHAPLNSAEGFLRQIIGWREFVRVYYEAMMPEVRTANALNFTRNVPEVFWTADSGMACVDDIVKGVHEHGWSHHIPRLMVLSNFSNLTQTDPFQLYLWFWYAYTDAYDWVVLPNVLGMSTFADGGVLASKPYVSGGNYIHKMSNYCSSCRFKIKDKTGPDACPFNYLYWNFVDTHRHVFQENGRVSFMVNSFDKRARADKDTIRKDAARFIESLPRWKKINFSE